MNKNKRLLKYENLIGITYGKLTIIQINTFEYFDPTMQNPEWIEWQSTNNTWPHTPDLAIDSPARSRLYVLAECVCGGHNVTALSHITSGRATSCGCNRGRKQNSAEPTTSINNKTNIAPLDDDIDSLSNGKNIVESYADETLESTNASYASHIAALDAILSELG